MSVPLPNQRLLRRPCKFGDLYAFGYWDSFGDQELTMNVANFECPACPPVIGIEAQLRRDDVSQLEGFFGIRELTDSEVRIQTVPSY